jgi:hypothetical protein
MRDCGAPMELLARAFTAMQQTCKIDLGALELGPRMMMIAARSCGATAPAGISR